MFTDLMIQIFIKLSHYIYIFFFAHRFDLTQIDENGIDRCDKRNPNRRRVSYRAAMIRKLNQRNPFASNKTTHFHGRSHRIISQDRKFLNIEPNEKDRFLTFQILRELRFTFSTFCYRESTIQDEKEEEKKKDTNEYMERIIFFFSFDFYDRVCINRRTIKSFTHSRSFRKRRYRKTEKSLFYFMYVV